MDLEPHGGGCCGVTHLYNFPAITGRSRKQRREEVEEMVREAVEDYESVQEADEPEKTAKKWRCAVECILIPIQLETWRKPLEDVGFKEVFSFLNSNSGNICHVFYLETNAPKA